MNNRPKPYIGENVDKYMKRLKKWENKHSESSTDTSSSSSCGESSSDCETFSMVPKNKKRYNKFHGMVGSIFVDDEVFQKHRKQYEPKSQKIVSELCFDICKDGKDKDKCSKQLKYLISYIEDTYWHGDMPNDAKKAVVLMCKAVKNKKLFIYMISYSIFSTSGLKYLEGKEDEIYKSRGVLQIRGKENYEFASEAGEYDFLKHPKKLATFKKGAIIGSVAVYKAIAREAGIRELTFADSVRMMKPSEALPDNHVSELDRQKWLSRLKIYGIVKKIMEEGENSCESTSSDEIERTCPCRKCCKQKKHKKHH